MQHLQNQLHELAQKEMTRKEFLAILGFGIASVFGLSAILNMVHGQRKTTSGYGSSTYGGSKEF